ncbi:hypothetical protein BGX20_007163, partial [Mortierella sp. AD010]
MPETLDAALPTVLIIGAGLGGLMLAAILESANISYHILERATELRCLGSAIALYGDILPVFEQLGIYKELESVSLSQIEMGIYDAKLNYLGSMYSREHKIVCGYDVLIMTRPKLYEVLRKKVPIHKISMGKKVLRIREHGGRVTAYCSDNTEYECNILVGADGAYSAVRQSMYKQLEGDGNLPLGDNDASSVCYTTLVGVCSPPNPELYPQLNENICADFRLVIGDNNDSCYLVTAPNNQISWGLQVQLPGNEARDQQFRSSEWGSESVDTMLNQFQGFPCAFGGTMKDIFDATPKDLISNVFLEEKVYQTWYHGRSALIGDGAVTAMKDAVVLANCIYNMSDISNKSIETAFASYYRQRYAEAQTRLKSSTIYSNIMYGH